MSLTERTASNILWRGGSVSLSTALNFLVMAVLANLLAPADFGLRGILLVVMGFLTLLGDLGLGAALVHEETITRRQFSTIFYLNLLTGVVLSAGLFAGAGFVAAFFEEPRLAPLLRVMSLAFFLSSIGPAFVSILQKELAFKKRFVVDLAEAVCAGASAIVFAARGFGVWSMVYGYLIGVFVRTVLLWVTASMRPGLTFSVASLRGLLRFGVFVYGEQILNFLTRNLDNIIIGRFLGAEALGYYSLAYSLMLLPVSRITDTVTRVVFPAFSLIQRDDARLRAGYVKIVRYVSLITFPMMAGMLAVAPQLIVAVYGPKWLPAAPVLQIFCLVGALQSIVALSSTVQYAKGRTDISFKWNLLALGCDTVAFFVGLRWGIVGVAAAYAILALVLEPTLQTITNRLIALRARDFLRPLGLPAFGAALIVGAVLAFKAGLGVPLGLGRRALLAWSVVLGILVYAALIAARGRPLIREAARMIGFGRPGGAPDRGGADARFFVSPTTGAARREHRLAIVVATKDRPDEIRRLFESLVRQSRRPDEVIVIDGGRRPVREIVSAFPELRVTYRPSLPPSSSRQRNEGIALAGSGTTLVGFLDDDCVLEDGALAAMRDFWATADENIAGAAFNMTNHPETEFSKVKNHPLLRRFGLYGGAPGAVQASGFQITIGRVPRTVCVRWLPSGAAVWRREVFDRFRFDDWYDGYGYLEDLDFSYAVGKRRRLAVVAGAGYQHLPTANGRGKDFAFGRKEVRNRLHFVRKHEEFSLIRCYLTLGLRMMVTGALLLQDRNWKMLQRIFGNISALMGF